MKYEKMSRAQVSTEILVMIGIVLGLMIPLLLYAHGKIGTSNENLAVQKVEFASQRLISLVDSVGYLGGAAKIKDEIEMPQYVKGVTVSTDRHDLIFEMDSSTGTKQIVKSTSFEIDAVGLEKLSKPGTYFIEVSAKEGREVEVALK